MALASVLLLALLLVALSGCDSGGPKADENDPWTVVSTYVDAVNAKDADAIEDLVDPAYDAEAEIADRLARLGGKELRYETMEFRDVAGMADLTSVDLTLRGSGTETYRDSLSLARSDGRWLLVLGRHR